MAQENNLLPVTAVFCKDYSIDPGLFRLFSPLLDQMRKAGVPLQAGEEFSGPGYDPIRILNVLHNVSFQLQSGRRLAITEYQIDFYNSLSMTYEDLHGKEIPEDKIYKGRHQGNAFIYTNLLKETFSIEEKIIQVPVKQECLEDELTTYMSKLEEWGNNKNKQ